MIVRVKNTTSTEFVSNKLKEYPNNDGIIYLSKLLINNELMVPRKPLMMNIK